MEDFRKLADEERSRRLAAVDWNYDYDYYDRPVWTGGDTSNLITWEDGRPVFDQTNFSIPNPPAYPDDMSYYNQNFIARNAFRWFPTYNLNISLQKNIIVPVGARDLTFQIIGEVFNLLNAHFWEWRNNMGNWTSSQFGYSPRQLGANEPAMEPGQRVFQLSLRVLF